MLGPEIDFIGRDQIIYEGKEYLYLAGIDYHRMSTNPMITDVICQTVKKCGISPTGSRTTTGNHQLYHQLESKVAEFFHSESSSVFTTGYLANTILVQSIVDEFDIFFIDESAHSSLASAIELFDKKVIKFKFMNPQHLKEQMKVNIRANNKVLILSDGVFPARGEIAPLDEYAKLLDNYEGKILVDDAHAMAVVGKTGKGSWEEKGVSRDLIFQTGTLSKGFGTLGGVIQGSHDLIEKIQSKSSAYAGSTGLALPLAAAGIKSIEYLMSNPRLITNLQKQSLSLKEKFIDIGFDMPLTTAPIFSITYHNEEKNIRLKEILLKNGIYPPFINYPGAPKGGHFRFILTSTTQDDQIKLLFDTIKSSL